MLYELSVIGFLPSLMWDHMYVLSVCNMKHISSTPGATSWSNISALNWEGSYCLGLSAVEQGLL